jgi:hypothetical protein
LKTFSEKNVIIRKVAFFIFLILMKFHRIIIGLCFFFSSFAFVFAAYTVFWDVPEKTWYSDSVKHLSELKILQGNSDGRYRPNEPVSRAELAVALDRTIQYVQTGKVAVAGSARSLELNVPFTSQAPTGSWAMPYQEACEEASLIMVKHFLHEEELSIEKADAEILELVSWEEANGYGIDVSAAEIAEIAKQFYGLEASLYYGNTVTVTKIKAILNLGNPVIIPAAGQILANPNYTAGGPPYHMIVLIGYNETGFISHDPGTSAGKSYVYSFSTIENAIHDWTGSKSTVEEGRKAMVVLKKPE